MSKILRKNMKIFGISAGAQQIGKFGSLAAGLPAYSTDPETIQSLSNYLAGWYAAVIGNNSPAIQDVNAVCYLFAYQLAYLFQTGVAEWNTDTTYYIGSFASSGSNIYVSLTDDNQGNAVTSRTNWKKVGPDLDPRSTTSADTATAADSMILADPTSASFIQKVPAIAAVANGFELNIKNITTGSNIVTVDGNSANIDGSSTVVLNSMDSVRLLKNGSAWYII
jgi:hypothetical protein